MQLTTRYKTIRQELLNFLTATDGMLNGAAPRNNLIMDSKFLLENVKLMAFVPPMWCEPQSTSEEVKDSDFCEESETMNSHIATKSAKTSIASPIQNVDTTYDYGLQEEVAITSFLERGIQLDTHRWTPGTVFDEMYEVWDGMLNAFSNNGIYEKLKNFAYLRAKMEITVTINATPFHAGIIQVSYIPWSSAGNNSIYGQSADLAELICNSQKMRFDLDAQSNTSQCMCVPFFHQDNYISIPDGAVGAGKSSLGRLRLLSYGNLLQCDGNTDEITVTIFAKFVDVKLTTPTLNAQSSDECTPMWLEPQSKGVKVQKASEYHQEMKLSTVASSVAGAADMLAKIPVIGVYARATSLVATGVSKVAALFGFSRPVEMTDISFMRNMPYNNMATTVGSDTCQTTSVDPKQELSIDGFSAGLDGTDEMSISYVAEKESYIGSFTWNTSDTNNSEIVTMQVRPDLVAHSDFGSYVQIQPTALHYVSYPFENWTGSLIFRFKFKMTNFHRGKFAIIYDPLDTLTTVPADYQNRVFTEIYDLQEYNDVVVTVPWNQAENFKRIEWRPTDVNIGDASSLTGGTSFINGRLQIRIVNELTINDGLTPVEILCYIKAGKDFKLRNPRAEAISGISFSPEPAEAMEAQSSSVEVPLLETQHDTIGQMSASDNINMVFFGEDIVSLRALAKRYSYDSSIRIERSGSDQNVLFKFIKSFWSGFYGFNSNATTTTGSGKNFFYNGTTWYKYVAAMYVGFRGGIRYKLSLEGTTGEGLLSVSRFATLRDSDNIQAISTATSVKDAQVRYLTTLMGGEAGCVATNKSNNVLEVQIPFQSPHRWEFVDKSLSLLGTSLDSAFSWWNQGYKVVGSITAPVENYASVVQYSAAADDFSCFYFNSAPTMVFINSPP